MKERIERIKKRIDTEYTFDEAGDVVIPMQADLVWAIKHLEELMEQSKRGYIYIFPRWIKKFLEGESGSKIKKG